MDAGVVLVQNNTGLHTMEGTKYFQKEIRSDRRCFSIKPTVPISISKFSCTRTDSSSVSIFPTTKKYRHLSYAPSDEFLRHRNPKRDPAN
ncbi:hypothetical protein TNCV_898671 [Trichonephila clavipes]|nr:hypothetical protein TNCV_898671 [Trichonephila clavipes]